MICSRIFILEEPLLDATGVCIDKSSKKGDKGDKGDKGKRLRGEIQSRPGV